MWTMDIINRNNIWIIEVPEEKKEQKSYLKKIIAENFPNPESNLDIQVHEDHKSTNKLNAENLSKTHYNKIV